MSSRKYAVAYLRCSDPDQDLSIVQQREVVQKYAVEHGFVIIEVYEDDGKSGWKAKARRLGYEKMTRDLRGERLSKRNVEALLVWKINRLGRNQLAVMGVLLEFENRGIEVVSLTETWPAEKKLRKLLQSFISIMDEFYSENLSEDVQRGMAFQARRGRWVFGGPYPYGYSAEVIEKDRAPKLAPIPAEADVVANIVGMYIRDGDGDRKIAERLTLARVPPPARKKRKNGRAPVWTKKQIGSILTNQVYRGRIVYKDSVVCEDAHASLISESDWQAIKKARAERTRTGARRNPLRVGQQGIYSPWLECPLCEGSVCVLPGGQPHKRLWYYGCSCYQSNPESCYGFSARCDEIDPLITTSITDKLLTPENLRSLVQATLDRLDGLPDGSVMARRDQLRDEQQELTASISAIVELVSKLGSPLSQISEVRQKLTLLQAQREAVGRDLANLPDAVPQPSVEDVDIESFRRSIHDAFEQKSVQDKRQALKGLLHGIKLDLDSRSAVIEYAWMGEGSDYQGQAPYGPP